MNPGPLTLGELSAMAEGRCQEHWQHTSCLLAMLVNVNRDKTARAAVPDDFNPYRAKASQKPIPVGIEALKAFVPK